MTGGTIAHHPASPLVNAATSPYRFDDVTRDSTPTFTGTAYPVATRVATFYSDGDLVGTDDALVGGGWEITSAQLDDGVHELKARASNASCRIPRWPRALGDDRYREPGRPERTSPPRERLRRPRGRRRHHYRQHTTLDNATQALTTGTFTARQSLLLADADDLLHDDRHAHDQLDPRLRGHQRPDADRDPLFRRLASSPTTPLTGSPAFHAKSWPALATWCDPDALVECRRLVHGDGRARHLPRSRRVSGRSSASAGPPPPTPSASCSRSTGRRGWRHAGLDLQCTSRRPSNRSRTASTASSRSRTTARAMPRPRARRSVDHARRVPARGRRARAPRRTRRRGGLCRGDDARRRLPADRRLRRHGHDRLERSDRGLF